MAVLALAFTVLAVANVERERQAQAELDMASVAAPPMREAAEPRPAPSSASEAPAAEPIRPRKGVAIAPPRDRSAALPASTSSRVAAERAVSTSHSWYRDADGFMRGMREAEAENKAILVYFYTDWCPYCRRLDRDLLARQGVSGTTKYFVKIKINPEHGQAERMLADRYGISGYPSVYVHEAGSERAVKIRTMTQGRLKRPSEFADTLLRAAGERFTSR